MGGFIALNGFIKIVKSVEGQGFTVDKIYRVLGLLGGYVPTAPAGVTLPSREATLTPISSYFAINDDGFGTWIGTHMAQYLEESTPVN